MTRKSVLQKALNGEITWIQAAEILRLTPRQIRRLRARFKERGLSGLEDRRRGKPSHNRLSQGLRDRVAELFREKYFDFSVLHFYEKLKAEHSVQISYSSVKSILRDQRLIPLEAPRKKHRLRRERRPMKGMMLHIDGSTHAWFGENHSHFDLVAVLDDATSEIYSARFVPQEGTFTCMQVLRETVDKNGVFCSLYTDRATHFVITKKAGEKPDRSRDTQLVRALGRLGSQLIHAYTPQARGRMERLWRTWQGRLPQELRLNGIHSMDEANRYLIEKFIPWHNASLTCPSKLMEQSAFTPLPQGLDLNFVFSIQSIRVVNHDNTVSFKNAVIQIPKNPALPFCFVGMKVIVHEHLDGSLSVTHGPQLLFKHPCAKELISETQLPKRKAA